MAMYHSTVHLSIHHGWWTLAIMNKATMNIFVQFFVCTYMLSFLFEYLCRDRIVESGSDVSQLCPTLCDPTDCSPPGSSVHEDFPGKNTGVGCHFLLQGIFLTHIAGRLFTLWATRELRGQMLCLFNFFKDYQTLFPKFLLAIEHSNFPISLSTLVIILSAPFQIYDLQILSPIWLF